MPGIILISNSTWKGISYASKHISSYSRNRGQIRTSSLGKGYSFLGRPPRTEEIGSSPKSLGKMKDSIRESQEQLQNKNVRYFADHLPENQFWRFFPEFRESTAYLDIETTALDPVLHGITVITLYDGKQIFSYIRGKNLDDFRKE